MKCKAFDVVIEIEIQAVTCPGVWLCPNGKVTVQIYLLGFCAQTSTHNPVFPLLYHENFTFRKNFSNVLNLYDLDNKLDNEVVYIELIQWKDCQTGNVLATFKTYLTDLLYPYAKTKCVSPGVKVDLLMEATKKFPGILTPKIEILSKVTIKEVIRTVKENNDNNEVKVNVKLISTKCIPKRNTPVNQKKVCHSYKYYKVTLRPKKTFPKCKEHVSRTSKRSENLKQSMQDYAADDETDDDYVIKKVKNIRNYKDISCNCKGNECFCSLCAKYKCYFAESCNCCKENNTSACKAAKYTKLEDGQDKDKYQTEGQSECKCSKNNKSNKNGAEKSPSSLNYVSPDSKEDLDEEDICMDKFYKSLEEFYKKLYIRARHEVKKRNKKCCK